MSQLGPWVVADSSVQILFCDKTRQLMFSFSARFASEAGTILLQKESVPRSTIIYRFTATKLAFRIQVSPGLPEVHVICDIMTWVTFLL